MRPILLLSMLLVVAAGVVFSALNPALLTLDFHFFRVQAPAGAVVLGALLIGWLVGGLVAWLGLAPRLRREARRRAQDARAASAKPAA